jgi:hypothetical protein
MNSSDRQSAQKQLEINQENTLEQFLGCMYAEIATAWPDNERAPPLPSLASCVLAHRYQESWAPSMEHHQNINLLVLGESHLSTDSSVMGAPTHMQSFSNLPHLGHLNLVHCPSYGEISLLPLHIQMRMTSSIRNTISCGTWQFWRVLMVLAGMLDCQDYSNESERMIHISNVDDPLHDNAILKKAFSVIHKTDSSLAERLATKSEIVRRLRLRRIHFADVSPAPIAVGGSNEIRVQNKTSGKLYRTKRCFLKSIDRESILRISWKKYSSHLVSKYKPRFLIILGRSVLSAIGGPACVQQTLDHHGGVLLGAIYHPSCNQAKSDPCSRAMFQYLRHASSAASSSSIINIQNTDQVNLNILTLFNVQLKTKKKGNPHINVDQDKLETGVHSQIKGTYLYAVSKDMM